jgi:hypothetical protein
MEHINNKINSLDANDVPSKCNIHEMIGVSYFLWVLLPINNYYIHMRYDTIT